LQVFVISFVSQKVRGDVLAANADNNGNHYGKKTPTSTPMKPTNTPTVTAIPTATPSPTPRSIPGGPQTFFPGGMTGSNTTIKKGTITPYDPPQGSTQTVELQIADPNNVKSVQVMVTTDSACSPFSLTLSSGTALDGVWSGSWVVNNTYAYTYLMSIEVTNGNNAISHLDLTLR